MWDLKKNPPETMDVAFLFWNHKKIGQHLLPLKVPHRKIEFGIVFMFLYLYSFTYSYFWKNRPAFTSTQSASPQHWSLNWFILNVYFDCYFFLSINLIHIKHRHDISVLKSFNNSPACIYFHSKCLTARLSFELYLFLYLFIHSFTYSYFFTIIYLFHFI